MATKPSFPGAHILIIEKPLSAQPGARHEIEFDTEVAAKKAYKMMIAFWEANGHAAIKVEGKDKIVSVSIDVVVSVTLIVNDKKIAQVKRSGR